MNRSCGYAAAPFAIVALALAVTHPAAPASAATALRTVTTADKTASVGVPAGWNLAKGSSGYVYVTGPQGEKVSLGAIIIGKNAPAATSGLGGEVAFALPFSSSLKDKFATIVRAGAAKQGMPDPQTSFASVMPTKLSLCTRLLGGFNGPPQQKFEAIMCSLAPDVLGLYKNITFLAQVPASRAAQDRPIVEAIAESYRVTPAMFKKMLAPYTALPPRPAGGVAPAMPGLAPYQDPTNSDCFDYNVIRESPPWEVPMHCGGRMPG
jgi:hypothetical protein